MDWIWVKTSVPSSTPDLISTLVLSEMPISTGTAQKPSGISSSSMGVSTALSGRSPFTNTTSMVEPSSLEIFRTHCKGSTRQLSFSLAVILKLI